MDKATERIVYNNIDICANNGIASITEWCKNLPKKVIDGMMEVTKSSDKDELYMKLSSGIYRKNLGLLKNK